MQSHTLTSCAQSHCTVQSTLAGLPTGVACPSLDALTRNTWKIKPILTEAEVYCKPVNRYFQKCRCTHALKFTSASHTHSNKHAEVPHVCPCLCSVLVPLDGGLYGPPGKGLRAPKYCFSPHYCQSIHR